MSGAFERRPGREPAFNAPGVVTALAALLIGIHALRLFLPERAQIDVILTFAFLPIRYDAAALQGVVAPGGLAGDIWTFVTYAFLHADITHLLVNVVSMLAFGAPVAWRFGAARFLILFALSAAAGAGVHLALYVGSGMPLVGASAAVSGLMAASFRFVFQPGAPLGLFRVGGRAAFRVPALPLGAVLRDRRVVTVMIVWVGINVLIGLGVTIAGAESIAWEAHLGGLAAGFLLFPLLDPVREVV